MTPLPNDRYLLTRLQREWNLLSSRRSNLVRASAWQLTPRVLCSLDELLAITGLGPVTADSSSDEAMRQLVSWQGTTISPRALSCSECCRGSAPAPSATRSASILSSTRSTNCCPRRGQ